MLLHTLKTPWSNYQNRSSPSWHRISFKAIVDKNITRDNCSQLEWADISTRCYTLPEYPRWGSYSKKIYVHSLVDSDSTRREKHACISHSSGWAKFFQLGVFAFWECWPKNATFFYYNIDFLAVDHLLGT